MPGHTAPARPPRVAQGDAALVARAAAGDSAAFGELVGRHLRTALVVARRIVREPADAEDVCQDAFLPALEHIEECMPAEKFRAWLLTIVRRRALDFRRRANVRAAAVLGVAPGEVNPPAPARDGPGVRAERAETRRRLTRALGTLSDSQRAVVLLYHVHGWRHGEIARRLGVDEVTSRSHLFHARRRLRACLREDAQRSA